MGISSGIPLYIVLINIVYLVTRENVDISTIGLFALTQIPWTLKFLWAPFIDNLKIPYLTNPLDIENLGYFLINNSLRFSLYF